MLDGDSDELRYLTIKKIKQNKTKQNKKYI